MLSEFTASEVCRVCGKTRNRYVKTEGIYRNVIFDLMTEISGVKIIDDDRLPSAICCECSTQLQQAKSFIDRVKSTSSQLIQKSLESFQCRACFGPVRKQSAISISYKLTSDTFEKSLREIIEEISNSSLFLNPTVLICRSCLDNFSTYLAIKTIIFSSNSTFMNQISTHEDPLSDFVVCEEHLDEDFESELCEENNIELIQEEENNIELIQEEEDKIDIIQEEETECPPHNNTVIENEIFLEQIQLDNCDEVVKIPKSLQPTKVATRNSNLNNPRSLIVDEVIVTVDRKNDPIDVDPIDEKKGCKRTLKNKPHIKKYKCLKSDCELLYFTKVERFHHMRIAGHMPLTYRQFYCYCGENFKNKLELNNHVNRIHNQKFKCNSCDKIAFTIAGIQRHITQVHSEAYYTVSLLSKLSDEKGNIFRCAICNFDCSNYEDFKTHTQEQIHIDKATFYYKENYYRRKRKAESDEVLNKRKKLENQEKESREENKTSHNFETPNEIPFEPILHENSLNKLEIKTPTSQLGKLLNHAFEINPEDVGKDPKLLMVPKIQVLRLNIPKDVNRIYYRPSGVIIYRKSTVVEPTIKNNPIIEKDPAKNEDPVINQPEVLNIKSEPNEIEDLTLFKFTKPKTFKLRKKYSKKPKFPVISGITSLHPKEIAKKLRKENPPPPLPDPTPETIGSNFEFIDKQILCKTCNRVFTPSYYHYHITTKLHSFLIDFPQFRSDKVKRQQKLTEGQIFAKMKLWCDVCRRFVMANLYEKHVKTNKTHQFLLENPDLRPNKQQQKRTPKDLDNDILSAENKKVMICDYCRKGFRKKNLLEEHVKRHCESYQIYDCVLCDQKFFTSALLLDHTKKEHRGEDKFYHCEPCNKKVPRYRDYVRHLASYPHLLKTGQKEKRNSNERKIHTCFICDTKFVQREYLKVHYLKFHSEQSEFISKSNPTNFEGSIESICGLCNRTFKNQNDLQVHYIMEHDRNDIKHLLVQKSIICNAPNCGKILHRNTLKAHVEDFHPASLLCHVCGTNFETVREFRYHRDYGHLPFMFCDMCGKFKTQSKARLWKHIKSHIFWRNEENKKFFCEFCGYNCFYRSRLNRHLLTHGIGVKDKADLISRKKFHCDLCDKSYVDKKDLKYHKWYKHEGKVKQHKFSCDICGLKFYKRNKYTKHLNTKNHMMKAERLFENA